MILRAGTGKRGSEVGKTVGLEDGLCATGQRGVDAQGGEHKPEQSEKMNTVREKHGGAGVGNQMEQR
jgi:hypothetical protein